MPQDRETREVSVREGRAAFVGFGKDVRYALRSLARRPGFALAALLTIALAIGANTAIFTIVNGVLLSPLPLKEPGRLVVPEVIAPTGFEISLSIPNFRDWREKNRTFTSFAANAGRSRTLTGGDRPEVLRIYLVLGDYFETLGVEAALGRTFESSETWAGAKPIAVVTHGFWEGRMGSDPDALGKTITLDGQAFSVVGIMPREFNFPSATTEVFLPMGFFSENMCWDIRDCSQGTWAIGRLNPGTTLEAAQKDLDRVHREIEESEGERVAKPRLVTLSQSYVGDLQSQIWILMVAVAFVLLIGCANVASLLLARGENRRRELAVRAALGAGRGRVVRQLLTESVLLSLAGGLAGVLLARLGVDLLVPAISSRVPSVLLAQIELDRTVLLFTLVMTIGVGILFGIAPALRASKADLATELKENGRGSVGASRQGLRSLLVSAEVALSLVLLISTGLMMQSLARLQNVDKGFQGERVLTADISLPAIRYDTKEKSWGFFQQLLERIENLPGTRRASLTNIIPLQGNSWERRIWPEGVPTERETGNSVLYHMISPGHFSVLGIPILKGRGFEDRDRDGAPLVAVIDESMAEKFWPGEDPIGKRVTFETEESDSESRLYRTVIGVAKNVRHYELENPSRIQVYVNMEQSGRSWTRSMAIMVQTSGNPLTMTDLVRQELAGLDPEVPLAEIETVEGYVDNALSGPRVIGGLLSIFSTMALVLSAVGVFGVMSYSVVQRLPEIGIRMALGAKAADVVRMVVRKGLGITLAGVVAGLAGAFALTRFIGGVLFEVDPLDPTTYGVVALFLILVSSAAAYLPARRATRTDPTMVLRGE